MIQRRLVAAPLVLALALGACDQGDGPTSLDEEAGPVQTVLAGQETITECSIVDFDGFAHGDAVTAITVQGVPLTLSAIRYDGEVPVDPTAYDVELTGDPLTALDGTHDDTQAERNCNDCAGLGRVLVVPDEDFATGGDNTEGGSITITGFADDTEGTWEITAYDVIDADVDQGFTELFVDDVFTARNDPRAGNAQVGDVAVPDNTIMTEVRFEIGNTDIAASSGIDNLRFCRSVEEMGGEGCTPGYWRQEHHYDSWVDYDPSDLYSDVFGAGPDLPLSETIQARGGGESAFLRHSTAALLNSTSDVSYDMSEEEVITLVQETYEDAAEATGKNGAKKVFNEAKDLLEGFNEQFCPLD